MFDDIGPQGTIRRKGLRTRQPPPSQMEPLGRLSPFPFFTFCGGLPSCIVRVRVRVRVRTNWTSPLECS